MIFTKVFSKKKTILMSAIIASAAANTSTLAYVPGQDGIETYEQGRYGHTYINPNSPAFKQENEQTTLENLSKFVEICKSMDSGETKDSKKIEGTGHAIYMQVPYNDMRLCSLLKKAGFNYRETWFETIENSNDRKDSGQIWMIQNNSSVPSQVPLVEASRCYIYCDEYLLMGLSEKMGWTAFGGGLDRKKGETSVLAVTREVKEEAGLIIRPEDLMLMAIIERTPVKDNCGLKTAPDTMFYYAYAWKGPMIPKEELKIQKSEIKDAKWMHWAEIMNNPDLGDHIKLTVSAIMEGTMKNPKFMSEEALPKLSFKLPDFHTRYKNQTYQAAQAQIWSPEMTMSFSLTPPCGGGGYTEKKSAENLLI